MTPDKCCHIPGSSPFHPLAVVVRLRVLVEGLRIAEVQLQKVFNLVRGVLFSWRWIALGWLSWRTRTVARVGGKAIPPWRILVVSITGHPSITPAN